jgi:hypothetical protein
VKNPHTLLVGDHVVLDAHAPRSRAHLVPGRIVGTAWTLEGDDNRLSYVVEVAGGREGFTSPTCRRLVDIARLSRRSRGETVREAPLDWFDLQEDQE